MKEIIWVLIMQLQTSGGSGTNEMHSVNFESEAACKRARATWLQSQPTWECGFSDKNRCYRFGVPTAICVPGGVK